MTVPLSDTRLPTYCGSSHWSLPVRCALPTGHGPDYHAGWTGTSGAPGRVYVRYWAETGVTEQLIAGVWQPTGIPGPRPEELLAEVDWLRAENEAAHRDAFEAAMAGLRLHAAWRSARRRANRVGHLYRQWRPEVDRLRAESENRRQAAAANAASIEVLQRQIEKQASELDRLGAELARAEAKVRAAETVKCWTNEDGQRFVFAEDIAAALGYTPTTPAAPTA